MQLINQLSKQNQRDGNMKRNQLHMADSEDGEEKPQAKECRK